MPTCNPLPELTHEDYRKVLAGLIDPSEQIDGTTRELIRIKAVDFAVFLARHFNRDKLDAVTIWERLGSAIETAHAKTPGGDFELFLNLCLDHILADRNRVLSDPTGSELIEFFADEPEEVAVEFIGYLVSRLFVVLTHTRQRWKREQEERKAAKAGAK